LWTTGNSILSCADPELAGLLLRQVSPPRDGSLGREDGRLARDFAARHHLPFHDVEMALDKIGSIMARERADYAEYLTASR
jgi:hypothetical protein